MAASECSDEAGLWAADGRWYGAASYCWGFAQSLGVCGRWTDAELWVCGFEINGRAPFDPQEHIIWSACRSGRIFFTLTYHSTMQQSKVQTQGNTGAPITNFSWNEKAPSMIVTSSIDTTCTVWNIETASAVTQLIAHDREVYDVAWLPSSTDIFVSVGADGSLRAFDLRSLEHSTILYETPTPKPTSAAAISAAAAGRPATAPLLRIAFNPADANYMATFHIDSSDIQILDMRSPGQPVMELKAHKAAVNALGWGSAENPLLATAGEYLDRVCFLGPEIH